MLKLINMNKVLGWLFVLGLAVICLSSWAWFWYRHAKWGFFLLIGIMAAIVAYLGYGFQKSKKI